MDHIKQIANLVSSRRIHSISRMDMCDKIAVVIHCLLFDAGLEKNEAKSVSFDLSKKIERDDWR